MILSRQPNFLIAIAFQAVLASGDGESNGPAGYGDPKYWLKLQSLHVREGTLRPAFDPNKFDYVVWLNGTMTNEVVFAHLDLVKYDPLKLPVVSVNGKIANWAKIDSLEVPVLVNSTFGPVRKDVVITLEDPHSSSGWGFWASGNRKRDYVISVRRPPIIDSAIKAANISAWLPNGKAITADPFFDAESSRTKYTFKTDSEVKNIFLQVICTNLTTRLDWNVDGTTSAAKRQINMEDHCGYAEFFPRCVYDDPEWTDIAVTREYQVHLIQEGSKFLDNLHVRLLMLPDQGRCDPDGKGYACASKGRKPRIVVMTSRKNVLVYFKADNGALLQVHPGLPTQLPLAEKWRSLRIRYGSSLQDYKVSFTQSASCSTFACPAGTRNKKNVDLALLCKAEACTPQDTPRCCENVVVFVGMKVLVDEVRSGVVSAGPDAEDLYQVLLDSGRLTTRISRDRLAPWVMASGTDELSQKLSLIGVKVVHKQGKYDVVFKNGARAFSFAKGSVKALLRSLTVKSGEKVTVKFCKRVGTVVKVDKQHFEEFGGFAYRIKFDDDGTISGPLPRAQLDLHSETCESFRWRCGEYEIKRPNANKISCNGYKCVKVDAAVCCKIKAGTKVEIGGRVGAVYSGPDKNYVYHVTFQNSSAVSSLTMSEIQLLRQIHKFHVGNLVRVFGQDAVVVKGPEANNMYRVIFSDDGTTSYSLPGFAIKLRQVLFKEGDVVLANGRRSILLGPGRAGKLKVRYTENSSTENSVEEVPPSQLTPALPTKRKGSGKATFAQGETVLVDKKHYAIVLGGPDKARRYEVAWPGGHSPWDDAQDKLHHPFTAVSKIRSFRIREAGLHVGDEVEVSGRQAVVVQGPDQYERYVVNFADDSSTSDPLPQTDVKLKKKIDVVVAYATDIDEDVQNKRSMVRATVVAASFCIASIAVCLFANASHRFFLMRRTRRHYEFPPLVCDDIQEGGSCRTCLAEPAEQPRNDNDKIVTPW